MGCERLKSPDVMRANMTLNVVKRSPISHPLHLARGSAPVLLVKDSCWGIVFSKEKKLF